MSDVSMARLGWFGYLIMLIITGLMLLWGMVPVLIRRSEYYRLRENNYLIKDALRAINENARLRAKYEPDDES